MSRVTLGREKWFHHESSSFAIAVQPVSFSACPVEVWCHQSQVNVLRYAWRAVLRRGLHLSFVLSSTSSLRMSEGIYS